MRKSWLTWCYFGVLLLLLGLCGCAKTPEELGITSAEWGKYTPEQQQAILENSHKINAENKVSKQSKLRASSYLFVHVSAGQAFLDSQDEWSAFNPVSFDVAKESCSDVTLQASIGEKNTILRSCYMGNTLFIDASRYDMSKKLGSVSINYSPLWQQGFVYAGINSSGFARLKNTTIEVKLK